MESISPASFGSRRESFSAPGRRGSFFEALSTSRNSPNKLRASGVKGSPGRSRGFSLAAENESSPPSSNTSPASSRARSPRSPSSGNLSSAVSPSSSSNRTSSSSLSVTPVFAGVDSATMSAVMDGVLRPGNHLEGRRRSKTIGGSVAPRSTSLLISGKADPEMAPAPATASATSAVASAGGSAPLTLTPFSKLKRLFRRNSEAVVSEHHRQQLSAVKKRQSLSQPQDSSPKASSIDMSSNVNDHNKKDKDVKKETSQEKSSDEGEDDSTSEDDKIVFPLEGRS